MVTDDNRETNMVAMVAVKAISSFKDTLIEHQYTKTPKSTILYVRKTAGMVLLDSLVRIDNSQYRWC
jgi:hypothetical protein